MKGNARLVLIVGALLAVRSAGAVEGKRVSFFSNLEYWGRANAHKRTVRLWKEGLQEDLADGTADSGSVASKITAGMGVRAGAMFPVMAGAFEVGGSVGYIRGPGAKVTTREETIFPPIHEVDEDDYKTSFLRGLFEARKDFMSGGHAGLRLRAGVGFAKGRLKNKYLQVDTGAFTGTFPSSASKRWSGLTYEAGPSFVWAAPGVNVELGVVYMALPKMKENLDAGLAAFKWNPVGFRFGVEF